MIGLLTAACHMLVLHCSSVYLLMSARLVSCETVHGDCLGLSSWDESQSRGHCVHTQHQTWATSQHLCPAGKGDGKIGNSEVCIHTSLDTQTYLREASPLALLAPPCFPTKEERGELTSLPSRDFVRLETAAMFTL